MAKYITDLADYLKEVVIHTHFLNNYRISSCRCLNTALTAFSSDTVYIGSTSDLPPLPPSTEAVNLLLIGDKEIPSSYHAHTGINWLVCDPQQIEKVQLVNIVSDFFQDEILLANYSEEILAASSDRQSLLKMLEITYKYIGNPLRVIDSAHNMVASYWGSSTLDEPQWIECEKSKMFSQEYNDTCNADIDFRRHMLSSSEPYVMNYPDIFKHRQRILRIRQKEMNIAFVSELEYNRPFTDFTSQILQIFGRFASIKLSNDAHFFCSYDSPASELLLYVLKSERINPLKIQQLTNSAGLNFRKYLYLIYITDGDMFDSREKMIYIRNILDRFFFGCLTQIIDGKVIILLDSDQCVKSPIQGNRLKEFINTLRLNDIFAGVSRSFRNIIQAPQALKQAKKAYIYSKQNQLSGSLFYYEDFVLDDLVQTFLIKESLEHLVEPGLYELIQHDKKHNGSLMETLTCYLNNQLDIRLTSEKLHVHFNTLKYRIQKIQDIMQTDLTGIDNILRLKISLIALRNQMI